MTQRARVRKPLARCRRVLKARGGCGFIMVYHMGMGQFLKGPH